MKSAIEAPVAKEIPSSKEVHGHTISDEYAWLREKENPEVIAYLEAENEFTNERTAHLKEFQSSLYDEMLGRIKEDDQSVPYRLGSYWYYTRTETGKAYQIHCRKLGSLEADEEIILDENALAKGHDFFDLGDMEISTNEQLMAYTVDTDGSEKYILYVKNLETGELAEDGLVTDIYPEVEWANDNKTIFYSVLEEPTHRPFQLYRHILGAGKDDELVFEEKDEAFSVSLYKTKDEKYFLLYVSSNVTTEMYFFPADSPHTDPRLFAAREHKVEFGCEHHEGWFYILTNEDALNFRLMRTRVEQTERSNWEEVISHNPKAKVESLDVFKEYIVVYFREDGLKHVQVRPVEEGRAPFFLDFDEPVYTVGHGTNLEYSSVELRFNYSSLTRPSSVFDYNMVTGERVLLKQQEVVGGYDFEEYQSERIFATSADGTQVPISLVYKKSMRQSGPQPLFLYAYGSYGHSIEPYFGSTRLSLIDRGVIFAIAHVRGGGTLGRNWYEDGKFLKKKNTFSDFIACAGHLQVKGYTAPDRLGIAGGSAGGLLMGAVVNERPDLFKVVQAHVPFVDVVNTMLDPNLPLTVPEYDEWGNPEEREFFEYMLSYSPYDNVRPRDYPDLLITAGLNDPRVHYWEPAKWCARLRKLRTNANLLLLKTNMDAGHQGASGRYGYLKELAFEHAFLLDRLGLMDKN